MIHNLFGKHLQWETPVQMKILPFFDRFISYSIEVMNALKENGIRCEMDG